MEVEIREILCDMNLYFCDFRFYFIVVNFLILIFLWFIIYIVYKNIFWNLCYLYLLKVYRDVFENLEVY